MQSFFIPQARAISIIDPLYGWVCDGFLFCRSGQNAVEVLTAHLLVAIATTIVPTAILMFLYGAIRMVISQGEEGKEKGKKAIFYAGLGLVFALMTGSVIAFVSKLIWTVGQ